MNGSPMAMAEHVCSDGQRYQSGPTPPEIGAVPSPPPTSSPTMSEGWKRVIALFALLMGVAVGCLIGVRLAHAEQPPPATNWIGFVVSCPNDLDGHSCILIAEAAVGASHGFDGLNRAGVNMVGPPVGWPDQVMCMAASAGVVQLLQVRDQMGDHNFPPNSHQHILCASATYLREHHYPGVIGWDYAYCTRYPYDGTCQQAWAWMHAWNDGEIP